MTKFCLTALLFAVCLSGWGCYQPTEGCLDLNATNYEVDADDPCADCCQYPNLKLSVLHKLSPATNPDTTVFLFYNTKLQSPADTSHFFTIQRCRYFISNLHLVTNDGTEVGVADSIWLELVGGDSVHLENNFAKLDRDIVQTATPLGEILAVGSFSKIRFTLGLPPPLPDLNVDSIPSGHALNVGADTIIFDENLGYLPVYLAFTPDTLPDTAPLVFHFLQTKDISLDLPATFNVERGFDIRLSLLVDYMKLFENLDLKNGDPATWQAAIDGQLAKCFSVSEIKLE